MSTKKISAKFTNPEAKFIWEAVLRAKAEVDTWPAWKRGGQVPEASPSTPPGPGPSDPQIREP